MHWKGISKPKGFVAEEATPFYGKFTAEPFERGFGVTIGSSIRRVLLSSLKGWAVTAVRIDGVQHQFSPIPGVVEDATEIILNLKKLRTKLAVKHPKVVYLSAKGPGEVTAANIKPDPDVEILTPAIHIAELDEGSELNLEIRIEYGRGYVPSEQHDFHDLPEGWISVDSIFSPVKKVNFKVENVLHLERADYDRLCLEIWTDGSLAPEDAAAHASKILKDIFQVFITFEEPEEEEDEEKGEEETEVSPNLKKSIEELDLGSRPMNCLRSANIRYVAQLVSKTDQDLLKLENFGKESLREVKKVLAELDLELGQDLTEVEDLEPYLYADGLVDEKPVDDAKAPKAAKAKAPKRPSSSKKEDDLDDEHDDLGDEPYDLGDEPYDLGDEQDELVDDEGEFADAGDELADALEEPAKKKKQPAKAKKEPAKAKKKTSTKAKKDSSKAQEEPRELEDEPADEYEEPADRKKAKPRKKATTRKKQTARPDAEEDKDEDEGEWE